MAPEAKNQPFKAPSAGSIFLVCVGLILATILYSEDVQLPKEVNTNIAGKFQSLSVQQLDLAYSQWLAGYKAADPAFQDYCMQVLTDSTRFKHQGSQYSQDVFLFHNFYKYWPVQNKTGFYIESGANDPVSLSNTLFFDKCLNWKGLCIEPQPQYHKGLRERRSCQLVPECITAVPTELNMTIGGAGSAIGGDAKLPTVKVQCAPIEDIVRRYTKSTQEYIDLWVLDVEGYELQVLNGTDFSTLRVDTMMIEDIWLPPAPRVLDVVMGRNNFLKYQQLAIDSVFVRKGTPGATSESPVWYPPTFESDLQLNKAWAKAANAQLRKAWGW